MWFRFGPADVLALADTFPWAKKILLFDTYIPIGCLPYLGQLRELEELGIDLYRCTEGDDKSLEAALLGLCGMAPALTCVEVWNLRPSLSSVLDNVRAALPSSSAREACGAVSGLGVEVVTSCGPAVCSLQRTVSVRCQLVCGPCAWVMAVLNCLQGCGPVCMGLESHRFRRWTCGHPLGQVVNKVGGRGGGR